MDIDRDQTVCIENDRTENARIAQYFKASLLMRL
jgi:hypothetical protein